MIYLCARWRPRPSPARPTSIFHSDLKKLTGTHKYTQLVIIPEQNVIELTPVIISRVMEFGHVVSKGTVYFHVFLSADDIAQDLSANLSPSYSDARPRSFAGTRARVLRSSWHNTGQPRALLGLSTGGLRWKQHLSHQRYSGHSSSDCLFIRRRGPQPSEDLSTQTKYTGGCTYIDSRIKAFRQQHSSAVGNCIWSVFLIIGSCRIFHALYYGEPQGGSGTSIVYTIIKAS